MSAPRPLLCIGIALVAGCGEPPPDDVRREVVRKTESELVPLRIKRLEREPRIEIDGAIGRAGDSVTVEDADWQSESLAREAGAALEAMLRDGGETRYAEGFQGHRLSPSKFATLPLPAGFNSIRVSEDGGQLLAEPAFKESVRALAEEFPGSSRVKVVGMKLGEEQQFETEVRTAHSAGTAEAHATWRVTWQRTDGVIRLARLQVESFTAASAGSGAMFEDHTAGVFAGDRLFAAQQGRGIAHWAARVTRFGDLALTGHHGIAVGDADGDGREDVFVADGGSLPNRLYRQRADGTVEDISVRAGLDWYEDTRSALFVDLDNDGDQDLVVATIAMIAFAENDGAGVFTLRGGFPGAQYPFSMAAADYNSDGDLDIYICLYGEGDGAERGFASLSPVPFEDAQNGGRNVLLENLGGFGFADVTDAVGLGQKNDRWSFAAAWEDYDRDGDPDLYVANDFGENCLYRNDGGRFSEVAGEVGAGDRAAGMSVAWGDYNRDTKPDLYVGNMFSSAGGRLATQPEFAAGADAERRSALLRMAAGNSLFAGGDDKFLEAADAAGAAAGLWAWSSGFVDINNDGWEDLAVANGYITGWQGARDL